MAIVFGTSLNDVLAGTPDPDRIEGGAGNDRINGGAGDDEILGGVGSDTLTGDAGNDRLFGEDGNDGIYGGGGNDTIDGGIGDDTLIGDGGNDDIFGGAGNDKLYGGVGNDRLDGGLGNDLVYGEAGDDVFVYRSGDGNDTFVGGVGNDRLELQLNSADITEALRSDFAAYQIWAANQVAAAGSSTTLAGQATGDTFSFASLGISISVVEGLTIIVDGQQVALESLLNRAPTEIALSNASIAENAAAGTVVGFLSGTDADAGQSATLTFALAEPSNAFEIVGNQLVVKPGSVLDFEANQTFSVNVTATDTGGLSKTQIFTINLADVNEAPTTVALSSSSIAENEAARSVIGLLSGADPDTDPTSFAIAENAEAGTVIGLLSGTDPDAGQSATLTFALAEPSDAFEIVGNQLVVKPGAVLDFEAQKTFSVHVTATDAGGLSKTQVFTINVSDVNEVTDWRRRDFRRRSQQQHQHCEPDGSADHRGSRW